MGTASQHEAEPSLPGASLGAHAGAALTVRGIDCLDQLEALWLHLFDHHLSIGAAGLPVIARPLSWPRRRQLYEQLFAEPGTFVVLAERAGAPVGYALCHLRGEPDDTWDTGDVIGEVETLVVSPGERGSGLGTALLDAAEDELARRGAHDVAIAVMAGNAAAERFYRARGMTPAITYLMRLGPRP